MALKIEGPVDLGQILPDGDWLEIELTLQLSQGETASFNTEQVNVQVELTRLQSLLAEDAVKMKRYHTENIRRKLLKILAEMGQLEPLMETAKQKASEKTKIKLIFPPRAMLSTFPSSPVFPEEPPQFGGRLIFTEVVRGALVLKLLVIAFRYGRCSFFIVGVLLIFLKEIAQLGDILK
uniref:Uncharacterized protein n=1 Tax=Strigamia maritima TaxID=126957 RepID=T1J5X9_STRMM